MEHEQLKAAVADGKLFYEDYINLLADLNDWHIGGIPVEFLVMSEKFALTHCHYMSLLLSHFLPHSNIVEGIAKSYIKFGKPDKNQEVGYHAWLEFLDDKDGIMKVLDAVNFIVIDKDYFYKIEEIKPIKTTPAHKAQDILLSKPTQMSITNPFDKYRQVILIKFISNLAASDKGYFDNLLNKRLNEFKAEINFKETLLEFKQYFNIDKDNESSDVSNAVKKLFLDDAYKSDFRKDQLHMFNLIFGQIVFLEERYKNSSQPQQPI